MVDNAAQSIDFSAGPTFGELPIEWIHGAPPGVRCDDPPLHIHPYDDHTYVLRQSKAETYEAPFLYLLFGNDRALLLDSGAVADPGRMPLRATVDHLIDEWLQSFPRPDYGLIVAHTHGHGDHVTGDAQFADRPHTVVVARDLPAVQQFFGFADWPRESVRCDLGGRVLEVTGSPGHHPASVAIYDPWTGFLFTGDTVYPGRLYVDDPPAFRASIDALVDITETRPVTAVMGCHLEMTRTPRRDYPIGTRFQPDEPDLAMTVAQLRSVQDAAREVGDRPGAHVFDEFAIFNGRCTFAVIRQLLRRGAQSLWMRVRR